VERAEEEGLKGPNMVDWVTRWRIDGWDDFARGELFEIRPIRLLYLVDD